MAKAVAVERPEFGERVRRLRERLGLTQEDLADRGGIRREEVIAVEKGRNKGSSTRITEGLARGFGLNQVALRAYFDGAFPIEDMPTEAPPPLPASPAPGNMLREDVISVLADPPHNFTYRRVKAAVDAAMTYLLATGSPPTREHVSDVAKSILDSDRSPPPLPTGGPLGHRPRHGGSSSGT